MEPWLLLTTRRLVISHHRHHGFLRLLPLGGDNGIDAGDSACFDEAELNLWLDQITRLLPPGSVRRSSFAISATWMTQQSAPFLASVHLG